MLFAAPASPQLPCSFIQQDCLRMPCDCPPFSPRESSGLFAVVALITLCTAGCGKQDEIRRYSVAKQPGSASTSNTNEDAQPTESGRLLGAIVPRGEKTWFFKLTGPEAAVADELDRFQTLIKSVKFSGPDKSEPVWTLPEGWKQQPGSGMRFATVLIEAEGKPLELSVIPLPSGEGDIEEYALANINRWRGQLKLSPITAAQLDDESERLKLEDNTEAILVNMVGSLSSNPMGRPPFASAPFASGDRPRSPAATSQSPLTYNAPKEWRQGKVGGMRKAAFEVTDGDERIEITAIDLPASVNDLLANVNRWRQQVKLGTITAEELKKQVQEIEMGGVVGDYVEATSPQVVQPRETILGVIAVHGGKAWFIKLKGDAALAAREKKRFEAFVKSIKFNSAAGANHGK